MNTQEKKIKIIKKYKLNKEATTLLNEVVDTLVSYEFFYRDTTSWTLYDLGNFTEHANKKFDNAAVSISKTAKIGDTDIIDYFKEIMNDKFLRAVKKTKDLWQETEYVFERDWDIVENIYSLGEEREDYYFTATYSLNVNEDGEYMTTNHTLSSLRSITAKRKNFIKEGIKKIKKLEKMIKDNKAYEYEKEFMKWKPCYECGGMKNYSGMMWSECSCE